MARLISPVDFIGSFGNLTAYRMKGVNGIIVRTKGGARREQIAKDPNFANTRRLNAEFGGRSKMAAAVVAALKPIANLADYMIRASINSRVKSIQELDTQSAFGTRSIELSKAPGTLNGFPFNREQSFDRMVSPAPGVVLSHDDLAGTVSIPALIPGVSLFAPREFAWFRFEVVMGIVPDLYFSSGEYRPSNPAYFSFGPSLTTTPWLPVADGLAETDLAVTIETLPPDDNFTLIASVGIRFGKVTHGALVTGTNYGAGKILLAT